MGRKVTEISAAELMEELADAYESGALKWTIGTMVNDNGAVCLVGGLRMLTAPKSSPLRPYKRATVACELIAKRLKFPNSAMDQISVTRWNDGGFVTDGRWHRGATCKQDVIDVLKATAKDIRNRATAA